MRIELGGDVHITIVTPGYVESELTQGKYFSGEGELVVNQDMRDVCYIWPLQKILLNNVLCLLLNVRLQN